jgi:hypothetical protein
MVEAAGPAEVAAVAGVGTVAAAKLAALTAEGVGAGSAEARGWVRWAGAAMATAATAVEEDTGEAAPEVEELVEVATGPAAEVDMGWVEGGWAEGARG